MSNIKKVFISHNHQDEVGYNKLKEVLENAGIDIVAESGSNIADLETSKAQIERCDALVLYMTENIEQNELMKSEFKYAGQCDIRTVAVYPYGEDSYQEPKYVQSAGIAASWVGNRIVDAVNGSDESTNIDGSLVGDLDIARYDCDEA